MYASIRLAHISRSHKSWSYLLISNRQIETISRSDYCSCSWFWWLKKNSLLHAFQTFVGNLTKFQVVQYAWGLSGDRNQSRQNWKKMNRMKFLSENRPDRSEQSNHFSKYARYCYMIGKRAIHNDCWWSTNRRTWNGDDLKTCCADLLTWQRQQRLQRQQLAAQRNLNLMKSSPRQPYQKDDNLLPVSRKDLIAC